MKIIDLLNKIANGEEVPNRIMYNEVVWEYEKNLYDYRSRNDAELLFSDEIVPNWVITHLNTEVEILEGILDEEDKDIPPIPDDELHIIADRDFIPLESAIDYNFKVLKEKINQIAEELNRINNEEESSNKD